MNLTDFIDYCQDFYDKNRDGSIYPFATEAEIVTAVIAHVSDPRPPFPFDGDTMDREEVRDRILAIREKLGVGETDWAYAVNAELIRRGSTNLIQTMVL